MSIKRVGAYLLPLALISAFFLAACGSSPGGPASKNIDYSGNIVIWHGWEGSYLAEKQAIFDAYHKMHPNVTITLVHQEDVVQKSVTAINAGSGPDIIAWADDSLGTLAQSRIVIPLDDYISKSFVDKTYNKAAAQGVEFNNHVWGVPEAVEAVTIMYNKSLISADQLPKTTDDMLTFAQNYQAQHPGSYGIVWPTEDAYYNAGWFYGAGAFYVHEDGKVGLNTPAGISAGKFLDSFKPYLPSQIDGGVASSLFKEGKAAAVIDGPWNYNDYSKSTNDNVGFAMLPVVSSSSKAAQPFVGVKSLWVTKLSKNPALDADLMTFYTNAENQIAMAKANGEIPANLAADNDASVKALASVGGFALQATLGTALPNTPYMSQLWKPVADALTAIWTGAQTPEAALADAQQAAEHNIQQLNS
ncbi:MAG TPA: extracellular solute-binding protein [Ktedonobacterales bacterium]|jgi:maltose-binding protein MalE